MRQVRVGRTGILATAVLAIWLAPAAAQEGPDQGPEIRVTKLGGSTRFSPPMRTIDDLRSMVNTNRNEVSRVFAMVDLAAISAQVIDSLVAGNVTDVTITPGTHMQWMALKRSGRPDVLRNVRWAGRNSFDAFQVRVTTGGYVYTFVIPKVCGNLSLVSRTPSPMTMAREEPAPPPAPEPPAPAAPPPPPPPPPTPPVAQAAPPPVVETHNGWVASVLFGTNFQANTDRENLGILDIAGDTDSQGAASFAFSGQIAYLWENVGIEGLFDFTPSVDVTRAEFSEPSANSYMVNLITAMPFGPERRFQPYVSGGAGAVSLSTDLQDIFFPGIIQAVNVSRASQTKFGWNLGAGASAFAGGPFGFRADIRYFRAASSSNDVDNILTDDTLEDALDGILETSTTDRLTRGLLSGLSYWRANVGLAIRW